MSKYKGNYRSELDADEKTYSQEVTEQQDGPEPTDSEDSSFKKRYGDLRRHMQTTLSQKDQELAQMKEQLDNATRQQIRFPKTDEEIDVWSKKYPDVAKIIDTIARKRANEALEIGEKKLSKITELEANLNRKEAEQELLRLHPDFQNIRQDPAFHEWVTEQPQSIQDSLYKNNIDAFSAARSIDLYKADKGISKKKSGDSRSAAESVGRTSRSAPTAGGKAKFSESMVDRMSVADYEKNETAILDAMRSGNFDYDMTGAAR